jgi:hypothetical protein
MTARKRRGLALCGLIALALASTMALAQAKLADIAGRWEVTAVRLRPGLVQALTDDDPGYMGAVLEISSQRLAFVVKKQGGTFDDVCVGPQWDGARVHCASGAFGPPGSALSGLGEQLRLDWYDNAILTLRRAR